MISQINFYIYIFKFTYKKSKLQDDKCTKTLLNIIPGVWYIMNIFITDKLTKK